MKPQHTYLMSNTTETEKQSESKPKHTHGYWNPHPNYKSDGLVITGDNGKRWLSRQMYVAHGEKIICEVTMCKAIDDVDFGYPRVSDDAEFEANVALIAAAPDLLAALKNIVSEIRAYGSPECDDNDSLSASALKTADAIIAKAEGNISHKINLDTIH